MGFAAQDDAAGARRDALREIERTRRDATEARRDALETQRETNASSANSVKLGDALRADGLIGKEDKNYRLQYENGEFRVNGKTQPDAVREKYRQLLNISAGDKRTSFQFQVNE